MATPVLDVRTQPPPVRLDIRIPGIARVIRVAIIASFAQYDLDVGRHRNYGIDGLAFFDLGVRLVDLKQLDQSQRKYENDGRSLKCSFHDS